MPKPPKQPSLMMLTEDGSPMVEIFKMEYEDGKLILDAKALDSMRMNVLLTPEAIANGWPVVMANKKAIIAFAKKIPAALRARKKQAKETARRRTPGRWRHRGPRASDRMPKPETEGYCEGHGAAKARGRRGEGHRKHPARGPRMPQASKRRKGRPSPKVSHSPRRYEAQGRREVRGRPGPKAAANPEDAARLKGGGPLGAGHGSEQDMGLHVGRHPVSLMKRGIYERVQQEEHHHARRLHRGGSHHREHPAV